MQKRLEPHDGVVRQYAPKLRTFAGPGGLEVPVCTFEGLIRTIQIDDPATRLVFDAAFPAFKPGAGNYRNSDLIGGRYRRYAGSSGSLDAGSYFSVARWNRLDEGGLAREVFAYADPTATDLVLIDDVADPVDAASMGRRYGTQIRPGDYLLLFVHDPKRLVPSLQQQLAASDEPLPQLFRVPCHTQSVRIDNVIDLRLPEVQSWFFQTFSQEEWLNIHVPLPPVESFFELLVVMLGQYRGGNVMTQAVGRELRLWGIGGLVYPSARCDCAVVIEEGRVVDWYGWNLVNYTTALQRTGPFYRSNAMVMTTMGKSRDTEHGTDFFGLPLGLMKVKVVNKGKRLGSWQVDGLETLNAQKWISKLSPSQRQLLGLPGDPGLIERGPSGLDEVEQRLRSRYRALVLEAGAQLINLEDFRVLLGRLAGELSRVPGSHLAAINIDCMGSKLSLGGLRDAFVAIGTATGLLVLEGKGYVRFDERRTMEYFTTVGRGGVMTP